MLWAYRGLKHTRPSVEPRLKPIDESHQQHVASQQEIQHIDMLAAATVYEVSVYKIAVCIQFVGFQRGGPTLGQVWGLYAQSRSLSDSAVALDRGL